MGEAVVICVMYVSVLSYIPRKSACFYIMLVRAKCNCQSKMGINVY